MVELFDRHRKFKPLGEHRLWHKEIGPFGEHQQEVVGLSIGH